MVQAKRAPLRRLLWFAAFAFMAFVALTVITVSCEVIIFYAQGGGSQP